MQTDLRDLIDNPRETLEIELKSWLDLTDRLHQANIARHIAALANHGGGYIVFGFTDDLQPDSNRPASREQFNRDAFAGIVKRYLVPAFQCEVSIVEKGEDTWYPVVRVPGHGKTPVVAKKDGPQDKGKVQGIQKGTHYIRKPGPESAPIVGPEEWAPLIRRCLLNDRETLLGEIASLVQGTSAVTVSTREKLDRWHKEGEERYLGLLPHAKQIHWPVSIKNNRYQLSYLISRSSEETFSEGELDRTLQEVNNEVRNTVWTGWSMFYPFRRPEIAPAFHPEHPDGTGKDVLETNLLLDPMFTDTLPDFWRVSLDGRATLIRAYREDRQRVRSKTELEPGTWLSPETVLRETAELVTHAKLMARRFETATAVSFRCTWMGLGGREIADFNPAVYWSPGQVARASTRTVEGEWSPAQLGGDWQAIVAELGCPILRLFGITSCGRQLVQSMESRFVKL